MFFNLRSNLKTPARYGLAMLAAPGWDRSNAFQPINGPVGRRLQIPQLTVCGGYFRRCFSAAGGRPLDELKNASSALYLPEIPPYNAGLNDHLPH